MTKEFEEQVSQLLAIVDLNMNCSEILLNNFKNFEKNPFKYTQFINSTIGQYLITISNNHFFESISILSTLLCSNNKKEISFIKIKSEIQDDTLIKFESIQREFKDKGFLKLRHTIVDHKNEKILINPLITSISPFSFEIFNSFKKIYSNLSQWAFSNFDLTHFTANALKKQKGLELILDKININDLV